MNNSEKQTTAQPKMVALFVSDVHLNPGLPKTTTAFLQFLKTYGTQTEQLYLLGDLFEYWVGDDDLNDPYNHFIVEALRELSQLGVKLFWIAGNRDFLIGAQFANATGARLIDDPSIIYAGGKKIVLCHGDAQCTDDISYMQFRKQVRDKNWQSHFLAMPLAQRKTIVQGMRESSKSEQIQKETSIMDVNPDAIDALFLSTKCDYIIHGHTHRPARHITQGKCRYVLPDWDCDGQQARGGWIAITSQGNIERIDVDGKIIHP
ncbi:UDP-2,3-diacylglucosamine diphosphatase [Undibacterium sp. RuRC25W]|uniref:UDP-2,3-diacylglucosamine diphosphatase n=1 Tax=Undibacterium sp. RuRC25W TaxID=3413047 RepID=UPI003BF3B3EF